MNRRLRAVLSLAILWAAGWALIGVALGLRSWLRYASTGHVAYGIAEWLLRSAIPFAVLGAIGGGAFALILARAERNRSVGQLSILRVSVWGAFGGAVAMLVYAAMIGSLVVFATHPLRLALGAGIMALLGAGSAGGTLAVARRDQLTGGVVRRELLRA